MKGATFWFTGLSGAGKSTLSQFLKEKLDGMLGDNRKVFILDGDVIRTGLNKDLGFTAEDRAENIRRISEVAKLFALSGQICFVAFISPYSKDRDYAKQIHEAAGLQFHECHIAASLEVCEARDVKGLYKKAREGIIKNFTGISDPYEEPANPSLRIDTGTLSVDACANMVVKQILEDGTIKDVRGPKVVKPLIVPMTVEQKAEYDTLEILDVDVEQAEYIQTIGQGWAYPLKRFMNELELLECMHLKMITGDDGQKHMLSVPITQHISAADKERFQGKSKIGIKCSKLSEELLAVIEEPVIFDNRKEEISTRVFGTFGKTHPKVERILAQGDFLISGKSMHFLRNVEFNDGLDHYRMTPEQVNKAIQDRNADAIYAFQVRNPLHNGHVLMLNDAREQLLAQGYKNPILLLHPLGGWCKDDDVPLDYRMRQH